MNNSSSPPLRISRRNLLKWSAATAGGVALSTVLPSALFPHLARRGRGVHRLPRRHVGSPSCCNMCGGQCGIEVYVEDGLVRKIEPQGGRTGVVSNPNNIANTSQGYVAAAAAGDLGRICSKGNAGIKSLYDPERVQTPMRRVGPRGSSLFEPISWEPAIETIARNLIGVRARWGARSVVWFGEDHSFTHIQSDFCKALGTPNYSNHSNLCDTSRKSTWLSTVGNDRPLCDMENADTLLVFGWNFLSAIKWIHLAAIFTRARMNNPNFHFIYVDPIHNTTASKADRWVAPRPAKNGALALALCKRLIDAPAWWTARADVPPATCSASRSSSVPQRQRGGRVQLQHRPVGGAGHRRVGGERHGPDDGRDRRDRHAARRRQGRRTKDLHRHVVGPRPPLQRDAVGPRDRRAGHPARRRRRPGRHLRPAALGHRVAIVRGARVARDRRLARRRARQRHDPRDVQVPGATGRRSRTRTTARSRRSTRTRTRRASTSRPASA